MFTSDMVLHCFGIVLQVAKQSLKAPGPLIYISGDTSTSIYRPIHPHEHLDSQLCVSKLAVSLD